MPEALTKGISGPDGLRFLRCPNRWIITRTAGLTTTPVQWVVESDSLHPPGPVPATQAPISTWPLPAPPPGSQPWAYIGRQLPFNDWVLAAAGSRSARYVDELTAIGYGDPTFAALYANSAKVFGAFDLQTQPQMDPQYDLVGWYADPALPYVVQPLTAPRYWRASNPVVLICGEAAPPPRPAVMRMRAPWPAFSIRTRLPLPGPIRPTPRLSLR